MTRGRKGSRRKRVQVFLDEELVVRIDKLIEDVYHINTRSECIRDILIRKIDDYEMVHGGPAGVGRKK